MKTISDYLNDLKEKTGSDYMTAKLLKVTQSTIPTIRRRELMSDETAVKVADALGIDEGEVLIAAALARSSGPVLAAWMKLAGRMSTAASVLLLLVISGNHEAKADTLQALIKLTDSRYYVLCEVGKENDKRHYSCC